VERRERLERGQQALEGRSEVAQGGGIEIARLSAALVRLLDHDSIFVDATPPGQRVPATSTVTS